MEKRPDETKQCVRCGTTFSRRKKSGMLMHMPRWHQKITCCNKCHIQNMWAKRKEPVADRFWRQVEIRGKDDCWVWVGGYRDPKKGYGGFHLEGKTMMRAHRMAYILTHGEISRDVVVRHICDNAPCVNPAHLESGTIADNNMDRDTRGRHVAFTRDNHPRTKISTAQLPLLRQQHAALPRGPTGKIRHGYASSLAAQYGVRLVTLSRLAKG